MEVCAGLEIHFFDGSKLLLPSSRPGSKTIVVAKLYVHFYAAVVLGCVDDRITNINTKKHYILQYHEFTKNTTNFEPCGM